MNSTNSIHFYFNFKVINYIHLSQLCLNTTQAVNYEAIKN